MRSVTRIALVAAILLLWLTGCSSDGSDPAGTFAGKSTQKSGPGAEKPGTPATSPTEPEPLPKAGDGTDLAACRHGHCEVQVRAGDRITLDPALGLDTIIVRTAGPELHLDLRGHEGLDLVGRDVSSATSCVGKVCKTTGDIAVPEGGTGQINSIRVSLEATRAGTAIVTLRAG